ncbi:hypothetical protein GCM10010272_66120 [Streptomyces lateritius]|nr:hypothetical protein GCM10010272_66120 [Streptomyces lateritius]
MLCPIITDEAKSGEWLEDWTNVSGVEGIVVKGMSQPYRPGLRDWYKLRRRDITEAILGAVSPSLARPQLLILGRHDHAGHLCPIGRTVPLRPDAAHLVDENLAAADLGPPLGRHPLPLGVGQP